MRSSLFCAVMAAATASAMQCPDYQVPLRSVALTDAPRSLALDDLNNDGYIDAVTLGAAGASVLLNTGNGELGSPTVFATGGDARAVAVGDMNNDGFADIVVTSSAAFEDIIILINNGDGTFTAPLTLGSNDELQGLSIGDINGDGNLDVLAANLIGGLSLFRGNGSPGFSSSTNMGAGAGTIDATFAAIATSLVRDLVVANRDDNSITIRVNNGFGGYIQSLTLNTSGSPVSVVAADFDANGRTDIAAAMPGTDVVAVFYQTAFLTFDTEVTLAAELGGQTEPVDLIAADLDGDGDVDLAAAARGSSTIATMHNEDGTLVSGQSLKLGSEPIAIAAADLDNDGAVDLVAASDAANELVSVFNLGGEPFQDWYLDGPYGSDAGDIDGDGDLDVVVASYFGTEALVMENVNGRLVEVANVFTNQAQDVKLHDLNGDGILDLVASNPFTPPRVVVRMGNGDFTFGPSSTYAGANQQGRHLAIDDFTGDQFPDIVMTTLTGGLIYLVNDGLGSFTLTDPGVVVGFMRDLDVADLDHDGDLDLAIAIDASGVVRVLLNDGAGVFSDGGSYSAGLGVQSVVLEDFNLDGHADMVSVGSISGTLVRYRPGNGDGTFGAGVDIAVGTPSFDVVAGDFNGDSLPDFAYARSLDDEVVVMLGDGTGSFAVHAMLGSEDTPFMLLAADFDGNASPDLLVTNYDSDDLTLWLSGCAFCPGDIADDFGSPFPDGMVSFGDFLLMLGYAGACGPGTGNPSCFADIADDFGLLGGDGMVSFGDFLALLGLVGTCP